jgi:hypothetical protein
MAAKGRGETMEACRCSNGWRGRRRGWEYLGVFGSGLRSKTNGRKGKTGKGDKSLKQSSHFSTVLQSLFWHDS